MMWRDWSNGSIGCLIPESFFRSVQDVISRLVTETRKADLRKFKGRIKAVSGREEYSLIENIISNI